MTDIAGEIEDSIYYLGTEEALQSIERDPYWPKWDSPWWHMSVLDELGFASRIPKVAVDKMVHILKSHYLPIFPLLAEDMPAGTDPYRKIACLCSVGNMYQILFRAGVNVDQDLPWMREWLFKYQLPDGGYNCDESAYTKVHPKSSIVSTVSCLEAILFCTSGKLSVRDVLALDKGASYLLKHKLFRRASTGEVIDQNWLEVRFPRFYEYDFLRGYYFLAKWREYSGFSIPDSLTEEVESLISKQLTNNSLRLQRYNLFDKRSYNPTGLGTWSWGAASEFSLLKAVSFDGASCDRLFRQWNEIKPKRAVVNESYETVYHDPIKLKAGDIVTIEKRELNPEWAGWAFCRHESGSAGWVSEKYLDESGPLVTVIKDYEATELTAAAGEVLKIYFEEFGWCWCKNQVGIKGWLPTKNLSVGY